MKSHHAASLWVTSSWSVTVEILSCQHDIHIQMEMKLDGVQKWFPAWPHIWPWYMLVQKNIGNKKKKSCDLVMVVIVYCSYIMYYICIKKYFPMQNFLPIHHLQKSCWRMHVTTKNHHHTNLLNAWHGFGRLVIKSRKFSTCQRESIMAATPPQLVNTVLF